MEKEPNRQSANEIKRAEGMMTDEQKKMSAERMESAKEELIRAFVGYLISLDEGTFRKVDDIRSYSHDEYGDLLGAIDRGMIRGRGVLGKDQLSDSEIVNDIVHDIGKEVEKRMKEWRYKNTPGY